MPRHLVTLGLLTCIISSGCGLSAGDTALGLGVAGGAAAASGGGGDKGHGDGGPLPLPKPSNPSPFDGETGVSTTPTLTWYAPGADHFSFFLTKFQPPDGYVGELTTTSYTPALPLDADTSYYWRVDAHSDTVGVGSGIGDVWSFRTAPPPGSLVWAKSAGGENDDRGNSISALSDGTAFVTGWFNTSATFGAG
ncbi:MAG: hypothetical protein E3J72_07095, partial [Planctomycetota bacterium]